MRTSNPFLQEKYFKKNIELYDVVDRPFSAKSAFNKTFLLIFFVLITAGIEWYAFYIPQYQKYVLPLMFGGLIIGLISAVTIYFVPRFAKTLAIIYALAEGFIIGGISALLENMYRGIAIQAVLLTFIVALCMYLIFRLKIIKVNRTFLMGIVAATSAIALIYILNFILGFFKISLPFIYSNGISGILFSLIVCAVAALNLVLDFHFIYESESYQAPKQMEWLAAFGLVVTLLWLYLELLRLLSKIRRR